MIEKETRLDFSQAAAVTPDDGDFRSYIGHKLGGGVTQDTVLKTLAQLQVPVPKNADAYVKGAAGGLIFRDDYGVVVRAEMLVPRIPHSDMEAEPDIRRINNNPWILRPLFSFSAMGAVIEIMPGVHNPRGGEDDLVRRLAQNLHKTGLVFFDDAPSNVGLLPFTTANFPDGVPVVIDRNAVSVEGAPRTSASIRSALEEIGVAENPQKTLYAPLRAAFTAAFDAVRADPQAGAPLMQEAWRMCREFSGAGRLVAGWHEDRISQHRLQDARKAAISYKMP
jgi:hypothetical protein